MTVIPRKSNKMKLLWLIILITAVLADDEDIGEILKPAISQFTARMTHETVSLNPSSNVVLSAYSVIPLLMQLALTAVGETREELLFNIGLAKLSLDNDINSLFNPLKSQLRLSKQVQFKLANRIYVSKDKELNEYFALISKDILDSEVKNVDFSKNVETANEINDWVEDQTNHKIKDLLSARSFSSSTDAVLVNAIYFKAAWKTPFDKHATTNQDFHVTKDRFVKVPTMYKMSHYKYGENKELNAQVLEIPYVDDRSAMLIILPKTIDGISELQEKLKEPNVFNRIDSNLVRTKVEAFIPKFKIETTTDLKTVLEHMHIKRIFNPSLSQLNNFLKNSTLTISGGIQKAFIEVNEDGTEAAAANFFAPGSAYNPHEKRIVFKADRPFFFMVKMNSVPLFSGIMRE